MPALALDQLLGSHPEVDVLGWAKQVRYFYFQGSYSSGPMDLYEHLEMCVRFADHADLVHVLGSVELLRYAPGPLPVISSLAGGDQSITAYPDILQPLHCALGGVKCFVWVHTSNIEVSCMEADGVNATAVDHAQRIEALIDALGFQDRVDHGVAHADTCISAARFPDRFATSG